MDNRYPNQFPMYDQANMFGPNSAAAAPFYPGQLYTRDAPSPKSPSSSNAQPYVSMLNRYMSKLANISNGQ